MKRYLVGLKCHNHRYGCECTIDVPQQAKDNYEKEYEQYNVSYDDNCYYIIVTADNEEDITLDTCLRQQGATEYHNAIEIWTDYEIIEEI